MEEKLIQVINVTLEALVSVMQSTACACDPEREYTMAFSWGSSVTAIPFDCGILLSGWSTGTEGLWPGPL